MNTSRKNFIQGVATGLVLCITGWAACVYLSSPKWENSPREITPENALVWIQNKEIKKIVVKRRSTELIDNSGERFEVPKYPGDGMEKVLLEAAHESNITITQEAAPSGNGWLLVQFLPLILLGMFAICTVSLAIFAYKALFNKRVD